MAKGKHHINPETKEIGVCSATIRCEFAIEGEVPVHYESKKEAQAAVDEELKHLALPEPLKKKEGNKTFVEPTSLPEKIIGMIDDPDNDGPDPSPGFDEEGWEAWEDALPDTPDMGGAWSNYIDTGHTAMNAILRKDAAMKALEDEGFDQFESVSADVENLRNLFDSSLVQVVKHDSVVFRSGDEDLYDGLKYGDEFVDEGFLSTAQTDDYVGGFGSFTLRIVVPTGKKFIPGAPHDDELIFAPGTKFKVGRRFRGELQLEMVLDEKDEVENV